MNVNAAVVEGLREHEPNDVSVRDWLDRVTAATVGQQSSNGDDPLVATICAAAVDPLEIAAALEAAGMSHQVVNDTYGHPDVFTFARQLWVQVPFRAATPPLPEVQRPGNWTDLARGALYAAPAFIIFALTRALGVDLAWWTLPVALTWGWALGQATAFTGYTLRGRGNATAEAETGGWLLVVTTGSTIDIAALVAIFLGGDLSSILTAAGVTTYMVASAILLLHNEEWLAALLLVPAAVGATVVLVLDSNDSTDSVVVAAILGSAAGTVVAAARHLHLSWRGDFGLGTADLRVAAAHVIHGLLCGAALSLVAIQGARTYAETASPALLALPLLLTLGIMEWQLRTFKAGVGQLMRRHDALAEFRPMAWLVFQRSFGIYVATSVIAAAAVATVIGASDDVPPYGLLAAQIVLGAAFFLDLTIVSVGRLDLVLFSWLTGALVGLLYAMWVALMSPVDGEVLLWRSACMATTVAFVALFLSARRVASAAVSH